MNDDSPRKHSRSRNRSRSSSANVDGSRQQPQPRGRKAGPKLDPVEFWGDPGTLPVIDGVVEHSGDPRALLDSLGRPPVQGQETAAERWFTLAYERAAVLAGALAAAGELDRSE